jgi:hypothetical protein
MNRHFYNKGVIAPLLFFCIIMLTAFTFYLQVIFNNPNMALLPYIFLGLLLVFVAPSFILRSMVLMLHPTKAIDALVFTYITLTLSKIFLGCFLGVSVSGSIRNIFLYLVPVIFYFFIATTRNERIIQTFFYTVAISGLIAGLFIAYESYSKIALSEIFQFAKDAYQYSLVRMDVDPTDANPARIGLQYRTFGLMVKHSHNGTWIAAGTFAAFALLSEGAEGAFRKLRQLVVLTGFLLQIVSLSFTSILAFSVVYFIIIKEELFSVWRGQLMISKKVLSRLIAGSGFIIALTIAGVASNLLFVKKVVGSISRQTSYIFFEIESIRGSYLSLVLDNTLNFFQIVGENPLILLFGSIPGMESYMRGGDTGFFDSISFIGLPLYMAAVFGVFSLIRKLWALKKRARSTQSVDRAELARLQFAVAILVFILFMEGHYGVWMDKSVAILVFCSLGIVRRYLRL